MTRTAATTTESGPMPESVDDGWHGSRRRLLATGVALVGGAGVLSLGDRPTSAHHPVKSPAPAAPALEVDPFQCGVASGDPDASSVVLWTRLLGRDGAPLVAPDLEVVWELADHPDFSAPTATGVAAAPAAEGHSVHVVVPVADSCWFRFRYGNWTSPVGRTAPTPATSAELRIATVSCQNFEHGHFAAYRDLVEWAPELVVFLGDFIYERSWDGSGDPTRAHRGGEATTLDGYRDRYAQYLGDPLLAAARATCPWLAIWDDHEVENNYAADHGENDDPVEVFRSRRLAGYQSWWEHVPVRMARPDDPDALTIYRDVRWGDLAHLVLLDGRQYRSGQACGDTVLDTGPPCAEAAEPGRTMLGADQEEWLATTLDASTAHWPVLAQQTVVSDLRLGNGGTLNYDQWDGYPVARERLLAIVGERTERLIVLTGDIHLAGVAELRGVGVELVTTSVTSRGLVPEELAETMTTLFPHVVAAELAHRGYTRHTVSADTWVADYRIVTDVVDPASAVSTWSTFTVAAEAPDAVVRA